jgi:hypothetical protein
VRPEGLLSSLTTARAPGATLHEKFCLPARVKTKNEKASSAKPAGKRAEALSVAQTPESHLDEKVRSAETIEREQRVFENMLRKTKVNLRYAMMRRSKKFYSMSRQCEQLRRCSSSQLR